MPAIYKRYHRHQGYKEEDLLQSGLDHLRSAKILFDKNPLCYDSAGYLCHLGIELILKACLLHHQDSFPGIHKLIGLYKQLKTVKIKLNPEQENNLNKLDDFYHLRYTSPTNPVSIGDEHWLSVASVFEAIIKLLPDSLKDLIKEHAKKSMPLEKGGRILMTKPKNI